MIKIILIEKLLKIIVIIQKNLEELAIVNAIIIHNASYDTHFIINQLAIEFKGELNCIRDNMEKYITLSVPVKKECDNNKTITCKLKLLIVLDLRQLHYQNLLVTHLEFLIV